VTVDFPRQGYQGCPYEGWLEVFELTVKGTQGWEPQAEAREVQSLWGMLGTSVCGVDWARGGNQKGWEDPAHAGPSRTQRRVWIPFKNQFKAIEGFQGRP
jgi:hypothetical protein